MDAGTVYGSNQVEADALRTFKDGKFKVSKFQGAFGDFLPKTEGPRPRAFAG